MSINQAVDGVTSNPIAKAEPAQRQRLYFKFKKPSSSEGLIFGFWYRVVIVCVSMIPSWIALAVLGAWNNYVLEPWIIAFAAGIAIFPLTVGEIIRRSVYEKSIQVKAEVVEIHITKSGIKLTSEDQRDLESYQVNFSETSNSIYRKFGKRLFDVALLIIASPMLLPIMALVAIFISLDGHSPFYAQRRIGRNGKIFRVFKFRTMVHNSENALRELLEKDPKAKEEWYTNQKLRHDPRVTPIGVFLRKTSIDELPQLLNVLLGEMSFVGPRPIMVEQAPLYLSTEYYYMKPGIVGLWQISQRNDLSFAARFEYDRIYYKRISFFLDVSIIIKAIKIVLRGNAG